MKKFLSIMLSLVMVMALFTGCGDKKAEDNSSFFKEAAKMQNVKTGTADLEFAINMKGSGVTNDTEIPDLLKNGDDLALKLKFEVTAESETKNAVKVLAQYGANDYAEITTIVADGTKLYVNVGSISDFIKSIDESVGAQFDAVLGQVGASQYVSIDLKQVCETAGVKIPDMSESADSMQKLSKKMLETLDKSFADIQGKDGDDYTLTVGSGNADKVADAIVKFCEDGSVKEMYTELMNFYVDLFGADTEIGKQFAELKDNTSEMDEAIKEVKDNKDGIVKALKDSKINAVAKCSVTGDEGEREGKLSFDSGEFKDTEDDVTAQITLTSNIKEGSASIKDLVPTEGVVDLTAMVNAAMSQLGALGTDGTDGLSGEGIY